MPQVDCPKVTEITGMMLVNAASLTDRGNLFRHQRRELFDRMFALIPKPILFDARSGKDNDTPGKVYQKAPSSISGPPRHLPASHLSRHIVPQRRLSHLTRNSGYALMRNKIRVNQLNIGWMASDGEDRIQREYHGADADWLEKAAAEQPFGRLIDPAEVARAVTFLSSSDSGMMTGSVIQFDQSVWGGYSFAPPTPEEPMALPS